MSNLNVVNVVGGGNIGRELELGTAYKDFPSDDLQYEPEVFPALVINYESPKATIMLFSSGKYSIAGAKSKPGAKEAIERFESDLEKMLGEPLSDIRFELRYLVCTGNLGHSIDLNEAAVLFGVENTEYEPEQFPGLFYRPNDEEWFSILFGSGKIVVDGSPDIQEMESAFREIKKELNPA